MVIPMVTPMVILMPTLLVAMEIILATINVILMATTTSPSEVVVQIARSISLTAMLGNPTRKYSAASSMWMARVLRSPINSMITARTMKTWMIFVRSTTSGKKRRNIVKVIITHVAAEADPEADHAHALVVLTAAAAVAATAATRMMGPVLK